MYERITVNVVGTIIDWNGPFTTLDEAREEARNLADDYRATGRTIASIDLCSFYILDPAGREPQRIIVRPIA